MNVGKIMSRELAVVRPGDALSEAARQLWERDCGALPVVDDQGRAIGIVTDRDICMAAYTRGLRLDQMKVESVMPKKLHTLLESDSITLARNTMRQFQLRRLPVIDAEGKLIGLLTLNDLARETVRGKSPRDFNAEELAVALAGIGERPRNESAARRPAIIEPVPVRGVPQSIRH